ncbi:hypothetical protein [Xylanibacter ruminicola]|uniref:hypothetical protein n=1 Tax=Xylanibacter ruminicola TaxID=839 RepID=UPI00048D2E29|nr:hypothetical protein [Xylanibacter ruminicola]
MNDKTKFLIGHNPSDKENKQQQDYYATSPAATTLLLKAERFHHRILEPCCGDGYISKVLEKKGYEVTSTDLFDYGYGTPGIDFLDTNNTLIEGLRGECDIVTNVPYTHTIPMLMRALDLCRNKVAMLFPVIYITKFYFCPPTKLYLFTRRITIAMNGEFARYAGGNMIQYGWFVWYRGCKEDTTIRFLDNQKVPNPKLKPVIDVVNQTDYWNMSKDSKKEKILALYHDGVAKREIARIVGQSESCVRKWLKQME